MIVLNRARCVFLKKQLICFIQSLTFNVSCFSAKWERREYYFWIFGKVGAQKWGVGEGSNLGGKYMTGAFNWLKHLFQNKAKNKAKPVKRNAKECLPNALAHSKPTIFLSKIFVLFLKMILFKYFKNSFQKGHLSATDF